jgi:hypothetical protein
MEHHPSAVVTADPPVGQLYTGYVRSTCDTPSGSMPEVGCVAPQDAILHGHLRLEIGVGVVIHRPLW